MKLPPSVLAESWLPIDTIGAECMRDASAAQKPPLNRLHVWWARRPLTISRAAILSSVLPQWQKDWPKHLLDKFPTEVSYQRWFLKLMGILGDPVTARKLIAYETQQDIRTTINKYGYPRAFTYNPDLLQLEIIEDLLEHAWGHREITVCDPMSGGGSIPFESLRYGFDTFANELNPVASVILKATLDYPAHFGPEFSVEIIKWGNLILENVRQRLIRFYPSGCGETIDCYLWARTVACPTTGKPVPLSPNWWLQKGANPQSVRVIAKPELAACQFEILEGRAAIASKPDEGTVRKGIGRSPWTGDAIDGDYIKAEAQAGRMGQQLYAVRVKTTRGYEFRIPIQDDFAAITAAEKELTNRLKDWETLGLVPDNEIPDGNKTSEPRRYGMRQWKDMFSARQLLSVLVFVEELRAMRCEIEAQCGLEKSEAVQTYLGLALDKSADYNSRMVRWHTSRSVIAGTFDRHDFSFKWSYAEMIAIGPGKGFEWAINQVADSFHGIAKLSRQTPGLFDSRRPRHASLHQTKGNAASLPNIPSESIYVLSTDPPYYDNVMYAECSDFFYVWMKRTVGDLFPGWFDDELTNKDDEAVANHARFTGAKKSRELAAADYERKMAACFREMHRVLHPDGVLTVMFTHKKVEAWNTLATSLIGAGFSIKTSWPIHTESEHSLHQAKKNAAASTILLVCRKRSKDKEPVWWDDIKGEVQREARAKAREFHAKGISGVDLYISTFGPALSILSSNWPVLSSETDKDGYPLPLRPEVALDLARAEVIALRKEELLLGRKVQFDPYTDWYLMAWDAFRAEQFPGDEARKLAIVLGLELEKEIIATKRIATKKGADVILLQPKARRKKGVVDAELRSFQCRLDAAHTAMLVYEEDGARACEEFLKSAGLIGDSSFKLVLQAMMNAIPRTRGKTGAFIRSEAQTLDDLRLKFFIDDLTAPPEEEPPKLPKQLDLFEKVTEEDEAEEEMEAEED